MAVAVAIMAVAVTIMAVAVAIMAMAMAATLVATLGFAGVAARPPEAWPMGVAVPLGGVLVHLLVGGLRQPAHQGDELLEAQVLVSAGVQVLQDVPNECFIPLLLLQVGRQGGQGWGWPGPGAGSTAKDPMAKALGNLAYGASTPN